MSDGISTFRVIRGARTPTAEREWGDPTERGYRVLAKMLREAAEAMSRLATAEGERTGTVEERDAA